MPGLVGATLRRGGTYSSLRSGITYHETGTVCAPGEGWVRVKIFNLLMAELGPGLLRKGVLLRSAELLGLLSERADEFKQGCSATLDGRPIDIGKLGEGSPLAAKDHIFLTLAGGLASSDL
jgi:hypothetical protein